MSTATIQSTGERIELARYTTTNEQRILIGQRYDGILRVTDEPADHDGPHYLIEPQLENTAALDALITDYLATAKRLDYPPMHGWF